MDEHPISTSFLTSEIPSTGGRMTRNLPGTPSARALIAVNWVSFSETVSIAMWMLSPVAALTFWIISVSLYCANPRQPQQPGAGSRDTHVEDDVRSVSLEELVVAR